jgi:hypothetical protein
MESPRAAHFRYPRSAIGGGGYFLGRSPIMQGGLSSHRADQAQLVAAALLNPPPFIS